MLAGVCRHREDPHGNVPVVPDAPVQEHGWDDGFIIWAVRTRTLRDEILGSLTSNGVLQCVGDLLLVGAPPRHILDCQTQGGATEYVTADRRLKDVILSKISDAVADMDRTRSIFTDDLNALRRQCLESKAAPSNFAIELDQDSG